MKNVQYLIVFLLVIVIGMQGYYIYNNSKGNSMPIQYKSSKIIPAKQTVQPFVRDEDLDKIFTENPFEQMQKMEQNMQKIFNTMNSRFAVMPEFEKFFNSNMSISPALDFESYKDRYELKVSIPGSDKNSIKVTAKNGILSIEAKTKMKKDENSSGFIKKEIYEGSFVRSLTLPADANVEKMKTQYKDGVLKITLPKRG